MSYKISHIAAFLKNKKEGNANVQLVPLGPSAFGYKYNSKFIVIIDPETAVQIQHYKQKFCQLLSYDTHGYTFRAIIDNVVQLATESRPGSDKLHLIKLEQAILEKIQSNGLEFGKTLDGTIHYKGKYVYPCNLDNFFETQIPVILKIANKEELPAFTTLISGVVDKIISSLGNDFNPETNDIHLSVMTRYNGDLYDTSPIIACVSPKHKTTVTDDSYLEFVDEIVNIMESDILRTDTIMPF